MMNLFATDFTAGARATVRRIIAAAAIILVAAAAYLFVPPTHQARAQFADQGAWATATSVTSGGATTVTLALNNVSSLNDIVGVNISFNPAANSIGPVSIIVTGSAGTAASTALQRPSSLGLVALSLNELWAGETTSVKYNGSVFVLTSNVDMSPIGKAVEFRGSAAPRGALIEDGSCVSQTQYAALYSVISTTYGTCSGSNFKLPFSNGTAFVAFDAQGANGAANRITTASCAAPNSPTLCGTETKTLSLAQLPTGITVGNASQAFTAALPGYVPYGGPSSTAIVISNGTGLSYTVPVNNGGGTWQYATSLSWSQSISATSNNTSGSAHSVLNPVLPGIRAIKY